MIIFFRYSDPNKDSTSANKRKRNKRKDPK